MQKCESELSLWYLDDGTLAGDPETVLQDLTKIIESSNSLGLSINPGKCEVYYTNANPAETDLDERDTFHQRLEALAPEIKVLNDETLTLLGASAKESANISTDSFH